MFLLLAIAFAGEPDGRVTVPLPSSIGVEHGRLPVVDTKAARTRVDFLLSYIVTALAHRSASVFCYSTTDWEARRTEWQAHWPSLGELGPWRAYTLRKAGTVHLSPVNCAQLAELARSRAPVWRDDWPDALAWSVYTLAHEAVHISGVKSEAKADCHGMQLIAQAAAMLGRTTADGAYLATLYWKHWQPWLGPRVVSQECRDGGQLDLHPRNASWP
jgi:hypothetical protein